VLRNPWTSSVWFSRVGASAGRTCGTMAPNGPRGSVQRALESKLEGRLRWALVGALEPYTYLLIAQRLNP
jgi:hypothetical protein